MKIQRRFAFQFFTQLIALFVLIVFLLFSLIVVFGKIVTDADLYTDLMTVENFSYEDHIDEALHIDKDLKQALDKQHIWLLLYDDQQQLVQSYDVPSDVPTTYHTLLKDDRITYNIGTYTIGTYQDVTIVLGKKNEGMRTLETLKQQIDWQGNQLPDITTKQLIYYVDPAGHVLDTHRIAKQQATAETIYTYDQYDVERYTDAQTGKQLIVATKKMDDQVLQVLKQMTSPFIIFIVISLFCFMLFIYFYTRKFANPLLLFMEWIRQIGQKNYNTPRNKKDQPLFRTKKGRVRKRFKLYKDMIVTMEKMSHDLKQHDEERQRMDHMREEWISGLSHDLKTPLSTMIGYTKMLRSDHEWTAAEQQQFLAVMDDKANYMKELIDDLTFTYRLKNERVPLHLETIELNEWLRCTLIELMNTTAVQAYTFDFVSDKETIHTHIDPVLFRRVIDNLLMNAVKHNPTGTTITIQTASTDDYIQIAVIDDGVGMDERTLAQLFNRYYRGTATTDNVEGSGLGMAITEQLVKLHHGKILAHSTKHIGTTITVVLKMEKNVEHSIKKRHD